MRISEVSLKCDLSADTLRFYEKVGLIGPIQKDASGIRKYSDTDLDRIHFVKCMRAADLPIDVLVSYIGLYEDGPGRNPERKALLLEQKEVLQEKIEKLNEALDRLNVKIDLLSK